MEDWVSASGARIVVIFEGRDAAGKGGTIKRITQYMNPRVTRIVAFPKPPSRERTEWYFQRYIAQPAFGGRDRPVRSELVQPRRCREGPRVLHARGASPVPPAGPDLRAVAPRGRHRPAQVLVLGVRRGAGAPVPLEDRRPDAPVEALGDRSPLALALGRLLSRQGRDVRAHGHPGGALVRGGGGRQAERAPELHRPPALDDPVRAQGARSPDPDARTPERRGLRAPPSRHLHLRARPREDVRPTRPAERARSLPSV